MDTPSREQIVTGRLARRAFDYVETVIPVSHFNERSPRDDCLFGVERTVYAFSADENIRAYLATLQYFVLRGGLTAWRRPSGPAPSISWAIARKMCALMRTELPIAEAEPTRLANDEEGVLYYSPLGGELTGHHGVFIFSSDAMTIPPRLEIRLKFSESPLCPSAWKPLIMRVIAGTRLAS